MQLTALLEAADWQTLQTGWQALLALTEHPQEQIPWDDLRIFIDRSLNALQRLVLTGQLSIEQQFLVQDLVQSRFDQALEHLNLQRQQHQPYGPEYRAYRGPFSRHQAMGDLEIVLRELQQQLALQQVPRAIRLHVLHDDNFELLERYALQSLPVQRAANWQGALTAVASLSWTEQTSALCLQETLEQLPAQNMVELAQRVLKSSRFVQAQCSAVRVLARFLTPQDLQGLFEPLLDYAETPGSLIYEILMLPKLAGNPRWAEVLLRLVSQPRSDRDRGRVPFGQIRQLALKKLAEFPEAAPQLQLSFQQARDWEPKTRLQAIQTLARAEIYTGFEQVVILLQEAARQDDVSLLQQSVDTLVLQRDPAAIPFLLAVLNGQYRQETALERFRSAFVAERQEQYPFLLLALEKLGQPVVQDPVSGRWIVQKS